MKWLIFTYYLILILFFSGERELFAQDTTLPEKPELLYVTVDTANNNVNIYWKKSTSSDVEYYIIYKKVNTLNPDEADSIAFVPATEDSYTHVTSGLPVKEPLLYSISAVDMAGNKSIRTILHGTIYTTLSYDSCNNTMTLRWTKYQGWENNISAYKVFARRGNDTFQVFVPPDIMTDSMIVYKIADDTKIRENTQYYFFVQVLNYNYSVSNSNIVAKYTYMPLPPEDLLLDYVSVSSPRTVDLKFRYSGTSAISSYAILRSTMAFSEFETVKSFNNINSSPQTIQDSIITSVNRYFYRIGALNTCGIVIDTTNLGTNILLLGYDTLIDKKQYNLLEWNPYNNFPLGTDSYDIYRLDTAGNEVLISIVYAQNTYTDDLSNVQGQNYSGNITYQVKAVEYGEGNVAFSNFCEIKVKSDVWMPNAFTPNGDGMNDIFIPRLSFIPDEFNMQIYDRYGIVIFSSGNPEIGWDGRINGKNFAPEGVYIYHIQFSSFNGQSLSKTGHVTVFYPR